MLRRQAFPHFDKSTLEPRLQAEPWKAAFACRSAPEVRYTSRGTADADFTVIFLFILACNFHNTHEHAYSFPPLLAADTRFCCCPDVTHHV
eukprot:227195-Chlamydomonas_euryale.AAC.1